MTTTVKRSLVHQRKIQADGYRREDGLWDIVLTLTDTKTKDYYIWDSPRLAGQPFHDMILCVTIDNDFNVLACSSAMDAVPYTGACEAANDQYHALVGLNLMQDLRHHFNARVAKKNSCAHLTQMVSLLPTVAIQVISGELIDYNYVLPENLRAKGIGDLVEIYPPLFQVDRCAGVKLGGTVTKKYGITQEMMDKEQLKANLFGVSKPENTG